MEQTAIDQTSIEQTAIDNQRQTHDKLPIPCWPTENQYSTQNQNSESGTMTLSRNIRTTKLSNFKRHMKLAVGRSENKTKKITYEFVT